ncbi:CpsD/CapB family tyrosine-protein kinase [Geodermatophilaceae bacterium NBWT11]|nr:CpsD/CapB family tyrosine-protein kinase [Geodermatophilaceae bacterium NBWT11]
MTTPTPLPTDEVADARAGRPARSGRRRRLLVGALVGALVLGAGGVALAATAERPVSAEALVQSYADPDAVENPLTGTVGGDAAARNATYVETELVYLNGTDLSTQVATTLGIDLAEVDLEAARVGDSNVINITSTAPDRAGALAQAQTAADVYIAGRVQRLTDRINAVLASVQSQITANEQAIAALPDPPITGFDSNEQQRGALGQQSVDLLNARDTLQRAAADTSQIAGQIQQADVLPSGAVSDNVLTIAAAVLLGALLGAVLAPVVSALRGRVRDDQDVANLGVPVLSPDLPSASAPRRSAALLRAVQLQALQLPAGPVNGGSLAVVAATPGVGATFTAVAHALHAARRGKTVLVTSDGPGVADGVGGLQDHVDLTLTPSNPVAGLVVVHGLRTTPVPGLLVLVLGEATTDHVADARSIDDLLPDGFVPTATAAGWSVVVDAPPLDVSDEGVRAARQCRETLVVAAVGSSRVVDVDRAVQILHAAGTTPAGVLVNRLPRGAARSASSSSDRQPLEDEAAESRRHRRRAAEAQDRRPEVDAAPVTEEMPVVRPEAPNVVARPRHG